MGSLSSPGLYPVASLGQMQSGAKVEALCASGFHLHLLKCRFQSFPVRQLFLQPPSSRSPDTALLNGAEPLSTQRCGFCRVRSDRYTSSSVLYVEQMLAGYAPYLSSLRAGGSSASPPGTKREAHSGRERRDKETG